MRIHALVLSTFALASVFVVGCQTQEENHAPATTTATGLNPDIPGLQDSLFASEALAEGTSEIELAHLAISHSQSTDLRLLAQRICDDHIRANRDLQAIIDQQNIPMRSVLKRQEIDGLRSATGVNFDRVYLRRLVQAHRDDIKKFKSASRNVRNSDLREFAGRTLPFLEEHLRIAENIGKMVSLDIDVNEPAGAERPTPQFDPFYQGDPQLPHQFNQQQIPGHDIVEP